MNRVIIGIGSNINPQKNIETAQKMIAEKQLLLAQSQFVETEPIGYLKQLNFFNGVIFIETRYEREELKKQLKELEVKLGRIRTENKYGPRTIDLDIVVWNGEIVDADVYERDYLRNAVLEVWPGLKF